MGLTFASNDIVSPEILNYFASKGFAARHSDNEFYISQQLLSSSPWPSSETLDLDRMIKIPVKLESQEALEYMGFKKATAEKLWRKASQTRTYQYTNHGIGVLSIALKHIEQRSVEDAATFGDDWYGCMRELGIVRQVRKGIMHPENESIRFAHTCKFWVARLVCDAYNQLQSMDNLLRRSTELLQQPPTNTNAATIHAQKHSSAFATKPMPDTMAQHKILWFGGAAQSLEKFYNRRTDTFDIAAIVSPPRISSTADFISWTPQKALAEAYRRMAAHTIPHMETCLIQIAVPEIVIRLMTQSELYAGREFGPPDQTWLRFMWHRRRNQELPDFLKEVERQDLLLSHLPGWQDLDCSPLSTGTEVIRVQDSEGQTYRAIQWDFCTDEGRQAVQTAIHGKVWFHNYHPMGSM